MGLGGTPDNTGWVSQGGWRQAWRVRAVPGWRAPATAESWTGEGSAGCPRVGESAGSAVRVFPPAKQCLLVKLCRIKSPKESKSLCTPGQEHFPFFDRDCVAHVTGPFRGSWCRTRAPAQGQHEPCPRGSCSPLCLPLRRRAEAPGLRGKPELARARAQPAARSLRHLYVW